MFKWTPQKIALLKRLWLSGVVSSEIAKQFGVSRHSILGKIHRTKDIPNKTEGAFKKPIILNGYKKEPIKRQAAKRGVPLSEIGPHDCRWPYGDGPFKFCGKECGKNTYCELHVVRVWAK